MTALARIPVRILDQMLTEVTAAQRHFNECCRLSMPAEVNLAALDRLDALQDEARAMIEAATGVSWSAISGASL